jgi:hypothetical protein
MFGRAANPNIQCGGSIGGMHGPLGKERKGKFNENYSIQLGVNPPFFRDQSKYYKTPPEQTKPQQGIGRHRWIDSGEI